MKEKMLFKIKRKVNPKVYNFGRFFYRVFISDLKHYKNFGFFNLINAEFKDNILNKKEFIIRQKNASFYNYGWDVLKEKNGYSKLKDLNCVLDLGGFIGDSAIELIKKHHCKKVYVYEPEKKKFDLILKNIKLNKLENKIVPHNFAVVANNRKKMDFKKEGDFHIGSSSKKECRLREIEIVDCINIDDVLKSCNFDGLKCDIEGGEFEIIDYFIKNPKAFNFKKGVIEWHFFKDNKDDLEILKNFLKFLNKYHYCFYFYPQNKSQKKLNLKKEIKKIQDGDYETFLYPLMFYFEKKKLK